MNDEGEKWSVARDQWSVRRLLNVPSATCTLQLAILLLLLAGCGGPHESSVSGTVTLDGTPLDRGTVTFHPVGGGAAAYGQIQQDGRYKIKTGAAQGLAPGDYVVTVVATEPPKNVRDETDTGTLLTPPRYGTVDQSDLRFTVQPGTSRIDIELHGSSEE